MTKESYVKMLITESGHTMKSFAETIDLPYTTLLGMLTRGLGGASVQNVIKVCKGLSITIDDLHKFDNPDNTSKPFFLSEREKLILTKYREKPEMQPAIDALLGIQQREESKESD